MGTHCSRTKFQLAEYLDMGHNSGTKPFNTLGEHTLFVAAGQFQRAECVEMDHHAVATLGYIRGTYLLQRVRHGPREAAEYGRTTVELKAVPLEGVSAAPRDAMALAHCYVQSVLEVRFAKKDEPPGITSKNLMGQAGCILFFTNSPIENAFAKSPRGPWPRR